MSETKIGYKAVLTQKEYLKLIAASLINRFGDSIDAIAFTWIVYEQTKNAAWSAIIFGANMLPSMLITPLAGAWVEGRKKKNILIVTDLLRALCVAFIATAYLLGFLQAWMMLAVTLLISTAEAFRSPAGTALTPQVLASEYYEYGTSLHTTLIRIVELAGTAIAAGIIALIGSAGAIYVDMATFLLSAGIICLVHTHEDLPARQSFDANAYVSTLKEGFRYVGSTPSIRFVCMICLLLNMLLVPLNSLQAPMVNELFGGGAEILSIISIGFTLGMLLGSLTYPLVQQKLRERQLLSIGWISLGLFYLGIVALQPFYHSKWFRCCWLFALCVLFGYFISLLMALINVEIVKRTESAYLARVGGIVSALSVAAIPVTSFAISILVLYLDTATIFLITGLLNLLGFFFILRSCTWEKESQPQENLAKEKETL